MLKKKLDKKALSIFVCTFGFSFLIIFSANKIFAGPIKQFPASPATPVFSIEDDSFTIAGAPGIIGGGYRLVFSAGQPAGHTVGQFSMTGGGFVLEDGYISGIEAMFQITKLIQSVETPTGYPGIPGQIAPGARITYKLDFANVGEAAQTGSTVISAPIPASLQYATGTISLTINGVTTPQTDSADITDPCEYAAIGTVRCLISNVGAGATGTITFKTVVR